MEKRLTRLGVLFWEKLHDIGTVEGEDGDVKLLRIPSGVNEVETLKEHTTEKREVFLGSWLQVRSTIFPGCAWLGWRVDGRTVCQPSARQARTTHRGVMYVLAMNGAPQFTATCSTCGAMSRRGTGVKRSGAACGRKWKGIGGGQAADR